MNEAAATELDEITGARAWLSHMTAGRFDQAWQVSHVLLRRPRPSPAVTPRHQQSVWDGTPLDGRRVLVRCYHGLGDTIQFIRYAPILRRVASRVIVWCQRPLVPLLGPVDGIDEILPLHDGDVDAAYDVDVEVMELPFVFRTTLNDVPARVPYITAAPSADKRSTGTGQLDVGIVWKAGDWAPHRSLAFSQLAPLFAAPVSWHILQAGPALLERPPGLGRLAPASEPVSTAREMMNMDLVISVDSMTAHLAGALGIPVWTLLPADADWRWMRDRDDSPWYPTMRLFRQRHPGDWDPVVRAVAEALSAARPGDLSSARMSRPSAASA